ncbi:threonine dehydrogenase-like Zn-dependent dehydrogenase [Curtobacterium sp. PhB137]|uniref:zinc-dependent alcohol dehydrogenase n=1 Tax=Curtobacterium sp. PhB137 TaxID=2485182 RepID=UPI000F513BB9|nr:zinc-binding dehydrogenase [Curtobacterium sp. PhB137]RPE76795.1 threonine dehydrogenase-like Zn-dependent dehydrogenase [Curtobacterium sp. PhB137]
MRTVVVTGPGSVEIRDEPVPEVGPADVLIAVKACGVCGSDAFYAARGGIPPREGHTPLGHEVAGEVAAVGDAVEGIAVGDHVVVNPMGDPRGIIGNGGPTGGLSEFLLVEQAALGTSIALVPKDLPWQVAALNEPMAVALHAVNRTAPRPGDTVVVFGAGPIGLGAVLSYKALGVGHVVVVDVIASRLEKALLVGADAVVNSADEPLDERLIALHGEARDGVGHGGKSGTDVWLDAAGVPATVQTALRLAKHRATIGVVAVHKRPVEVDFGDLLAVEPTIVTAMGYPTEIFDVTEHIIANPEAYAQIVSDVFPASDVLEALRVAATPGAADKVVVTFD